MPVPVDGREAKGHDEAVRRYQVPIDGCELSCQDKTVQMASKKQDTSASADSANDSVPVDETVRVPQNLINGTDVTRIDFGAGYKLVMGWRKALN